MGQCGGKSKINRPFFTQSAKNKGIHANSTELPATFRLYFQKTQQKKCHNALKTDAVSSSGAAKLRVQGSRNKYKLFFILFVWVSWAAYVIAYVKYNTNMTKNICKSKGTYVICFLVFNCFFFDLSAYLHIYSSLSFFRALFLGFRNSICCSTACNPILHAALCLIDYFPFSTPLTPPPVTSKHLIIIAQFKIGRPLAAAAAAAAGREWKPAQSG